MEKLKIHGVETADGTGYVESFEALLNPEQVSLSKSVVYNEGNEQNSAGGDKSFEKMGDETLSFDLFFDGTGIVDDKKTDIVKEITQLEKVVLNYVGKIHRPYYLVVEWGKVVFRGSLKDYKCDYTMFKPDGTPLRAKATVTIVNSPDPAAKEMDAKKSSPDLTHVKTIRQGDSLPLLCHEVYGDFKYYVQVAEANGLTNFRELEVGSRVFFPPLDK